MRMGMMFAGLAMAVLGPAAGWEARLAEAAKAARGQVGAGLQVLETGESAWLLPDGRFPMQSVYKFPIGMAALAAVDRGELRLDQRVRVARSELIGAFQHSPIRDAHPEGGFEITVEELLRGAVSESDGTASDVLMRLLGGPARVQTYLDGLGFSGVRIVDTEMDLGKDEALQYRNWATPRAAVGLLKAFHEGRGLSPESRRRLLRLMIETGTGARRIKGRLPATTVVAHKTGTSRTVNGRTAATNDIGIVTLPNGKHLAVAVFVSGAAASETEREDVIAQVARLGWETWGGEGSAGAARP